jgi:hypothetical protein
MKHLLIFSFVIVLSSCLTLQQVAEVALESTESQPAITNLDIANGLKEALKKGVDKEVAKLTTENGFLGNAAVKIPFPQEVKNVEQKLRDLGLGALPDKGIELLNRAAEDAVKEATPIFISAIKNMSINDARNILMGHDSSATDYLEKTTSDSLYAKFYPVVQSSMNKVGADDAWNSITSKYNAILFTEDVNPDINDYVTMKALDGVFKMITIEEKEIRNNLQERTSDLLRRVFALQD